MVCPTCSARLPRRNVEEIWIEVPLASPWIAAYRMVAKGGSPVVAEVRLFPDEPRREAGRWSTRPARVPPGGLPGRVLGALRLRDPIELVPRIIDQWDRQTRGYIRAEVLKRFGLTRTERVVTRRPGRRGRGDLHYATWAAAYVARLEAGSRTPIKDLSHVPPITIEGYVSKARYVSPETVGDIIGEARHRGLLTSSPPGRPGGELTSKARRLLGPRDGNDGR